MLNWIRSQYPAVDRVRVCVLVTSILIALSVSGCAGDYRCRTGDYCAYTMPSGRQYVRAPDGWAGKYCSQHPENC